MNLPNGITCQSLPRAHIDKRKMGFPSPFVLRNLWGVKCYLSVRPTATQSSGHVLLYANSPRHFGSGPRCLLEQILKDSKIPERTEIDWSMYMSPCMSCRCNLGCGHLVLKPNGNNTCITCWCYWSNVRWYGMPSLRGYVDQGVSFSLDAATTTSASRSVAAATDWSCLAMLIKPVSERWQS